MVAQNRTENGQRNRNAKKWLISMKVSAAANGSGQLRAGADCSLCLAAVGRRGAASLHNDRS